MQERPTGKNLPVYASLSTMRQEPSQSEMNNGVIPLDTLPAAWWNWMWNAITQAQNDSMYNDDVLFTEINNVLTAAGITPGTSSQHDQLRQAIAVIKGAIATTAEAGSVLSTDSGTTGTVKVEADGRMTVNNFGDIASFHGAAKDNLMSALNETYDIAYGSNDSIGELSTLTTTAKDTLVDAINELDAGKAPTAHASSETTHGIGNADNYGHVKLTDTPGSADAASGTAATPKLVQDIVSGGLGAVNAVSYTFVVDSNDKLMQWVNNDKASGQDYTSVLIRKGEWTSTTGVNLTTAGTKVVVGEPGSKLVFNGVEKGLYYDSVPRSPEYYMRDVTVKTTSIRNGNGYGFRSCTNLTNCTGSGSAIGLGTIAGYGFHSCVNLTNCTGTGTSPGIGSGFGFYSCKTVIGCKAGGHCTTAVFEDCYASSTKTSTYACADTANGGFNNTTNPAA